MLALAATAGAHDAAHAACRMEVTFVVEDSRHMPSKGDSGWAIDAINAYTRYLGASSIVSMVRAERSPSDWLPAGPATTEMKARLLASLEAARRSDASADVGRALEHALADKGKARPGQRRFVLLLATTSSLPSRGSGGRARALARALEEAGAVLQILTYRVGGGPSRWRDWAAELGASVVEVDDLAEASRAASELRRAACGAKPVKEAGKQGGRAEAERASSGSATPPEHDDRGQPEAPKVAPPNDAEAATPAGTTAASGTQVEEGAPLWPWLLGLFALAAGVVGLRARRPSPTGAVDEGSARQAAPDDAEDPFSVDSTMSLDVEVPMDPTLALGDLQLHAQEPPEPPTPSATRSLPNPCPSHPGKATTWTCRFCKRNFCPECRSTVDGVEVCHSERCRRRARPA